MGMGAIATRSSRVRPHVNQGERDDKLQGAIASNRCDCGEKARRIRAVVRLDAADLHDSGILPMLDRLCVGSQTREAVHCRTIGFI